MAVVLIAVLGYGAGIFALVTGGYVLKTLLHEIRHPSTEV